MLNFKGLKKMKKLFVIFAVAAMFVACQKPAEKPAETTDSVATQVVNDSVVTTDSVATPDSATAAVK